MSIQDHYIHLYGPHVLTAETVKEANGHENISFQTEEPLEKKEFKEERIHFYDNDSKRVYRQSLRAALHHNPAGRLHQVVDRNLSRVDDLDVNHHLRKRKVSAQHIRDRVLSDRRGFAHSHSTEPDSGNKNQTEVTDILTSKHQELRRRKTISHRPRADRTETERNGVAVNSVSESTGL